MLSLCMIAKNEEVFLPACLESFKEAVDEIIVVDTGSTDKTKEIAQQYGAKLFHFHWADDFSDARNYALEQAGEKWIIMPDADDRLQKDAHHLLHECMTDTTANGYRIPIISYSNDQRAANWHLLPKQVQGFRGFLLTQAIKLFRNKKEIRYRFSVHESVKYSIAEQKGQIKDAPFSFDHVGFARGREISREKHAYYLSLSLKDAKQYPNHPKPFYELGVAYFERGEWTDAKAAFEQAAKKDELHLNPYFYLGELALKEQRPEEARDFFQKDLLLHPRHSQSYGSLGKAMVLLGNRPKAKEYFKKALSLNPKKVEFYQALLQLHLQQQELFPALALAHDAWNHTKDEQFMQLLNQLENNIKIKANDMLQAGHEEQASLWFGTLALYRKDYREIERICATLQQASPQSNVSEALMLAMKKLQHRPNDERQ